MNLQSFATDPTTLGNQCATPKMVQSAFPQISGEHRSHNPCRTEKLHHNAVSPARTKGEPSLVPSRGEAGIRRFRPKKSSHIDHELEPVSLLQLGTRSISSDLCARVGLSLGACIIELCASASQVSILGVKSSARPLASRDGVNRLAVVFEHCLPSMRWKNS